MLKCSDQMLVADYKQPSPCSVRTGLKPSRSHSLRRYVRGTSGSHGRSAAGTSPRGKADMKPLMTQTEAPPVKHPWGLSYEVQCKSKVLPAFLPTKPPGNKCGLSLCKFHSCIKAPELSPLPKLNSNLI